MSGARWTPSHTHPDRGWSWNLVTGTEKGDSNAGPLQNTPDERSHRKELTQGTQSPPPLIVEEELRMTTNTANIY